MSVTGKKNLGIGKWILTALILVYVGLSFFDCTETIEKVWDELQNDYTYKILRTQKNFPLVVAVCALGQIALVWLGYFKLQAIPAIVSSCCGFLLPLEVGVKDILADNIHYIIAGPHFDKMRMTPNGWAVFAVAWLLLITSAVMVWWLSKLDKELCQTPDQT